MMKLLDSTLNSLPSDVAVPQYDRSCLTPGIVHIGLGNFHRAHQAWYLHRLMQMGLAHDWAIIGAGVRPGDEVMRVKLAAQDYLTTLIELSPGQRRLEVIGSMIGFVPVQQGHQALIEQMADPAIRIVSLTVTEGGYYIDVASKGFDAQHPDMQHDASLPERPLTAFGAMIAALKRRRDAGVAPFTCMSCDNLQGNGKVLRQTVVSLAKLSDPDLALWIESQVSFPNSMVDSIVPATGAQELALVAELGIEDQAPVTHENFRQWVIEDQFCAARPPWEKVGATLAADVHAYETMKIRILNGGHQVIAAAGDLLGLETISACMRDPLIGQLYERVLQGEIVPHVQAVPGMTAPAYVALIRERFANPAILDTTRRVAFDGSSRQPGFILPSVRDCLQAGIAPDGLALVCAVWARYCLGTREDGSTIQPNDPYWDQLQARALQARACPRHWLENSAVYGELVDEPEFATRFEHWFGALIIDGVRATLLQYLAQS